MEVGSSFICWGLHPSIKTVGEDKSISSMESKRKMPVSLCASLSEVPSAAEQQAISFGMNDFERIKLCTIADHLTGTL